jgi:hypothetical protein
MNSYQKATTLVSFAAIPLTLLFMNAMNYSGVGAVAVAWLTGTAVLLYVLRTPPLAGAPKSGSTSGYESAPRVNAGLRQRSVGASGMR